MLHSESHGITTAPAPTNGLEVQIHDCWNRIGISGDASCPELKQFIHCRNCPVYSAAGARLLHRALPPGYREEWTRHFAGEKQLAAPGRLSALVFRLGTECLALPISVLLEVAERRTIHSIPHRRQGVVLGLVNIRGELLVCVSLSRLLGLELEARKAQPRTVYDRLLVAHWDGDRLVFPVDEVYGVHRFDAREVKAAPATVANASPTYTRGLLACRDRNVGWLNEELVFSTLNQRLT